MSLKGLAGRYREAKIVAREKIGARENKTESNELKDRARKIEEVRNGLLDVEKKVMAQQKNNKKGVEDARVLAQSLRQYGETCSNERLSSMLAGLFENTADLQEKFADLRSTMMEASINELGSPVDEFLKGPLEDARKTKQKYDSVRVAHDASQNKLKTLQRKKNVNPEQIKQAEQELTDALETYEIMHEETLSTVNDTLAQHEFKTLEYLCNYIKIQRQFFAQGLSAIEKLMPTVEKSTNMVQGLKVKYEKKRNLPGGFTGTAPPKKKVLFGVPIAEYVQNFGQPAAIANAIDYIREKGLDEQGIFRESGTITKVEALKERAENGEIVDYVNEDDGLGTDVHVVTGFIKLYLRELPEPLLSFKLYNSLIELGKSNKLSANDLRPFIESLPSSHKDMLQQLLALCHDITLHESKNRMTASNLSVVLAPNLLYAPPTSDTVSMLSMDGVKFSNLVVEKLIENYGEIFTSTRAAPKKPPPAVPRKELSRPSPVPGPSSVAIPASTTTTAAASSPATASSPHSSQSSGASPPSVSGVPPRPPPAQLSHSSSSFEDLDEENNNNDNNNDNDKDNNDDNISEQDRSSPTPSEGPPPPLPPRPDGNKVDDLLSELESNLDDIMSEM